MFRFTQEPSSGSYNRCLAKITSLVQQCTLVQTLSVLWRLCVYVLLCEEALYSTSSYSEPYTRTAGQNMPPQH